MQSCNRFTIISPPSIFNLLAFFNALMVGLAVVYTLTTPPPHTAMYIFLFLFIIFPCAIGMLYLKIFKVTVAGRTITVRKGLGFKYSLDISEIEQLDWKTRFTSMGQNEKIVIRTASKKFTIETLMIGSDKMIAFLKENVAESKIRRR